MVNLATIISRVAEMTFTKLISPTQVGSIFLAKISPTKTFRLACFGNNDIIEDTGGNDKIWITGFPKSLDPFDQ